jgi:serine/threonine protein kinase
LLLEPALGGELYATYHKYRFHGDVKKAKYYSGTVVYCFDHLHQRNILYRDLKPENLLLDDKGHCKITDMGLAKVVIGKTYTTCGTPDYFAPEVIQQTGMGKGVDWWTLGVLIHELMSGHAPFEANDPMETYQKIVRGVNRVRFTYKDADAQDLVKQMLRHQPSERLPMRVGGIKNVKSHKWYAGFDWDKLFMRALEPPYKPNVKGPTDLANFRANEADLPPQISYKDDGSGWDADF